MRAHSVGVIRADEKHGKPKQARFIDSWKMPSFVAPSPKMPELHFSFLLLWANAAPQVRCKRRLTIPFAPRIPTSLSVMCIDPPMPFADAGRLPEDFRHHMVDVNTLQIAALCPLCVANISSSGSSAPQVPAAVAFSDSQMTGSVNHAQTEIILHIFFEFAAQQHIFLIIYGKLSHPYFPCSVHQFLLNRNISSTFGHFII